MYLSQIIINDYRFLLYTMMKINKANLKITMAIIIMYNMQVQKTCFH